MIKEWLTKKRCEILQDIIDMLEQGSFIGFLCGLAYLVVMVGLIILKYAICFWLWKEIVVNCCGGPQLSIIEFLGLIALVKIVIYRPADPVNQTTVIKVPMEAFSANDVKEIVDKVNGGKGK